MVIQVLGKLTFEVIAKLRDAIRGTMVGDDALRLMVIDLSGVSYIDSSGLGLLIAAKNSLAKGNCILRLTGLTPQVKLTFDKTNLTAYFELYEDETTAVAALLRA
jgi:anti-anti-sigma factor